MSLESKLTQICNVTRLAPIIGTNRESYQTATSFPCLLQPTDPEEASIVEGTFGKTFKMFCQLDADVQDTDKVAVEGQDYLVRGISKYDYSFAANPHKKVILQLVVE